ncbi:MAG TPA: malto-oligosyltrehalose trehalohydrolase [Microlunatus sp.]|nr:malto-oligosyltrehalose trehalohydrolase [Microlunatus sp.]
MTVSPGSLPLGVPIPFTVWAPRPQQVTLVLVDPESEDRVDIPMARDTGDWWQPTEPVPDFAVGEVDYGFSLDGGAPVADPRSRRQPYGVHGLSRTFDPGQHTWGDTTWTGRQLAGGVIYELHVGTFTPEGTLTAAIDKLDHLVALGVDFIELMPVNAFNGERNWGYDGVLWYAVQEEYGGPAAYQSFVDACHQRGLAVVQDVVYNHLGPSGNYLPEFAPYMHSAAANTWGESVNLDGEDSDEVRRFIIENAQMWFRDYHVDALRLDAVHALTDTRATHVLEELAVETSALSVHLRRPLSLIAESDLNDPRLITRRDGGGYGLTAQWSDDFHHALYVALTGDTSGYYADFDSLGSLAKVLTHGFFHDGTMSTFRGRTHGNPIDTHRTPTWRLVVCADNHDQIGNRADGRRLSQVVDPDQLRIAALVNGLSPYTPMIFMGEEWGATTPWQFFTAHTEPELAEAVRTGRTEEFAKMGWDLDTVPDPQDPATFERSKLDWSELGTSEHAELLAFQTEVLRLRRAYADFTDPRFGLADVRADDDEGTLVYVRGSVFFVVNFSDVRARAPMAGPVTTLLTVGNAEHADEIVWLGPHSALAGHRHLI